MSETVKDVDQIFWEALQIEDAERRNDFIRQACGGDEDRRLLVEKLIRAQPRVERFLEKPFEINATAETPPIIEKPGTQIGPYKLLEQLGEGGMGVVYMAEQKEPVKRRVALKIIKPGMDTRQVIARFEAERQALAMMDHPNIAKVLDAGQTESGRPYFVMELVKGMPVTNYCDEQHLTPKERLELFVPICQAVQHAHQKGIIHRDLKPSNILVALYDGQPVPKIIDFGVAKATSQTLTEKTMFTQVGQVVGTLEYMAPEQAQVNQLDVDTRSDVYSLGVVLYELLTGETPFDRARLRSAAFDEMLRIIREEEPSKPSTKVSSSQYLPSIAANRRIEPAKLGSMIRGELDWIVLKAMEKDRGRRYETASKFAEDVQHYLNDEPVTACPPSKRYLIHKFVRRHRHEIVATSLFALVLCSGVASIGWLIRDRIAREQKIAREEFARQERTSERVTLAVRDIERLMEEREWLDALQVARRAKHLIALDEADEITRDRLSQLLFELSFLERLENLRIIGHTNDGKGIPYSDLDNAYAEALGEIGIRVDNLRPEEVDSLIQSHAAISVPLAAALDEWARAKRFASSQQDPDLQTIVHVATKLDPDPTRCSLRSYLNLTDTSELRARTKHLAQAERLENQPAMTLVSLGVALRKSGLLEDAIETLRFAQRQYPDDFWVNFELAFALSDHNPADSEVTRFYSVAIGLRPKNAAALNNLAIAYASQGNKNEAIVWLRKAAAVAPDVATFFSTLGSLLAEQGATDDAIVSLRRAIELDRQDQRAWHDLGVMLSRKEKTVEAIDCFREAIALDPEYGNAFYNLGVNLERLGQHKEAIASLRRATELKEDFARAWSALGVSLFREGVLNEAAKCFREAIAIDPNHAFAHSNLAAVLKSQEQLEEAVECARKATKLEPNNAEYWNRLGLAQYDSGDWQGAVDALERASEIRHAKAPGHQFVLAIAYWNLGRLKEARLEFSDGEEWLNQEKREAKYHKLRDKALEVIQNDTETSRHDSASRPANPD